MGMMQQPGHPMPGQPVPTTAPGMMPQQPQQNPNYQQPQMPQQQQAPQAIAQQQPPPTQIVQQAEPEKPKEVEVAELISFD